MSKTTKETPPKTDPVPSPATPAPETPPQSTQSNYSPLSDAVNEKSYSTGAMPGATATSTIPEHNYAPPPPEEAGTPKKEYTKQEQKRMEDAKKQQTGNPDMQHVSEQERMQGAAAMASMILTTWEQGYKGLNNLFKISEKKVADLQASGKIDTRVEVPYEMGRAPLSKVLRDYNNDADGLLVLEPEFKEEVHPLLTEEFAKSGHGLSSRQQLMLLIGMKLVGDGYKAVQFLGMKKDYLRFAAEQTELARRGGGRPAAPTPPPPPPQNDVPTPEDPNLVVDPNGQLAEEEIPLQPMTLQEEAMAKMFPQGRDHVKDFGNKKNLKLVEKTAKTEDKGNKKSKAANHIAKAKQTPMRHDPVPTSKNKGRGRPPGAKNKPKKK